MSNLYFDAGPSSDGRKVMVATTVYDSPDSSYTFAMARTGPALMKAGIKYSYLLLSGNAHVDDARNTVARDFLKSDCTELVFIDADVTWEPEHLLALLDFDVDVVGGVYPYRRETGNESMPVRNMAGKWRPENGLLEVEGLPTGFLRIKRHVIETLAAEADWFGKPDGECPLLFERTCENGQRWGGDINFCRKWRDKGGRCFAAADLRLGHTGKHTIKDTLGASLRRQAYLSLPHVVEAIRRGEESDDIYYEAMKADNNPWAARTDVLHSAVHLARQARKPILEVGSGLSTVLMAAATDQTVWAIEHDAAYAARTESMARKAGVTNIALVMCPLKEGWYDIAGDLPDMPNEWAFALVDGPPRALGDRMKFFEHFGGIGRILLDDADDKGFREKVTAWANDNGREATRISERAMAV